MNLQEELKALKQRIAELEELAKEEQEFPQDGDEYHFIEASGRIDWFQWDESGFGLRAQDIGNIYKTAEEARFVRGKLKVEAELRKCGKPFEDDISDWYIFYDTESQRIHIDSRMYCQTQGAIYFESEQVAQRAIDAVGEERIKKYIFGVED